MPPARPTAPDGSLGGGHRLGIANSLAGLKHGASALHTWLKRAHVGVEAENRAQLVFDEIVTNIIRYGFDDENDHRIELSFELAGDNLTLTFDDDGRPFDPRTAPDPVHTGTLAGATVGGRGIYLVRKTAQRLDYERTDSGRNRLTVTLASR